MAETSSICLCAACGALYHFDDAAAKCKLCGGRVAMTTERIVAMSGFTPYQLIEATKRAVEGRAPTAEEGKDG